VSQAGVLRLVMCGSGWGAEGLDGRVIGLARVAAATYSPPYRSPISRLVERTFYMVRLAVTYASRAGVHAGCPAVIEGCRF